MEIIRRGLILSEEEDVANQLRTLPNNWWCIGGDGNRFVFKKGEGTQIDFLVIAPKGIFLIDAKNIHTVEMSDGNIRFLSAQGKVVRKDTRRNNPVEEIIEERYQAKDWLKAKGLEEFLTKDRKELKIYVHGMVVIANENNVQYKNCKLDDINYHQHKYPTLITLSQLNKDFFDQLHLPPNCSELSQEEMWALYKIFYNPDMTVTQILNEVKKEEEKLFEEKHIFLEKLRLLEEENISLSKNSAELQETRNNLLNMNKELSEKVEVHESENKALSSEAKKLEEENQKLKNEFVNLAKVNENYHEDYDKQNEKITTFKDEVNLLRSQLSVSENENKKLNSKVNRLSSRKFLKQLTFFRISTIAFFLISITLGSLYYFAPRGSIDPPVDPDEFIVKMSKHYPFIYNDYHRKDYQKVIDTWQNKVLQNNDFTLSQYKKYETLFYFLAKSYYNKGSYENAIRYFDIFTELSSEVEHQVEGNFYRSIAHIELNKDLDRAVFELREARDLLLSSNIDGKNQWLYDIYWYLSIAFEKMSNSPLALKKFNAKVLKIKINEFTRYALRNLQAGSDLALRNNDIKHQINFQLKIGNIYDLSRDFKKSIEQNQKVISTIRSSDPRNEFDLEKTLAYGNIGVIYSQLSQFKLSEKNYLKAIEITLETKQNTRDFNENLRERYRLKYYRDLTNIFYYRANDAKKAIIYAKPMYELAKKLKVPDLGIYQSLYKEIENESKKTK